MDKQEIEFNDFQKIDIRVGTVVKAEINKKAHKPAYILEVDFGEDIGLKKSSAQVTNYSLDELKGRKIIAVCDFPKKNIAGIESEVLILGAINKLGKVVLLKPDEEVENGDHIA